MLYDEKVEQLISQIKALPYVQDFQKAERAMRDETVLFELQEEMKRLQKEAILYREIGKMQAFKETSQAAQKIEKSLKNDPLVERYFLKLQDVNDLVQYVTNEIERKVNFSLGSDEK